jgi:hypothetical protein
MPHRGENMITGIIIGWLVIGLITWGSAMMHDTYARQDKIVKWINEAIQSKDLPRSKWPLLEEQNYPFISFVKGFIATLLLWPMVVNRKLGGW